jgi:hypothetical protein
MLEQVEVGVAFVASKLVEPRDQLAIRDGTQHGGSSSCQMNVVRQPGGRPRPA